MEKSRKGAAERDGRMEEAMEKLSEGVRSITSSHEFIRYLTFVAHVFPECIDP